MSTETKLLASVLGANFSKLGSQCQELEAGGIDGIQWDVMDGQFVPNLTMGPSIISSIRPHIKTYFEAHLMVLTPENMATEYVEAGCERIIIHYEACPDLSKSITTIKEAQKNLGENVATETRQKTTPQELPEIGLAINPETPPEKIEPFVDEIDMVLVMTVNPGFGGQSFIPEAVEKIPTIRKMLDISGEKIRSKTNNTKELGDKTTSETKDIEVDGGINNETIISARDAGANLFIAGNYILNHPDGMTHAISELKSLI